MSAICAGSLPWFIADSALAESALAGCMIQLPVTGSRERVTELDIVPRVAERLQSIGSDSDKLAHISSLESRCAWVDCKI